MDRIEELKAEGYEVVEEFTVNQTMSFAFKQYSFKRLNVYTLTFFAAVVFVGMIFGATIVVNIENGMSWGRISSISGSAVYIPIFAFLFIVVPIHELLHGYAFKCCGVKKLKYGVIWSSLAFYCAAYDFVADYKQFKFVGLLPNIVINAVLLTAYIAVLIFGGSLYWQFVIIWSLIFHITGGVGDMALVGYLYGRRNQGVVTYDDLDNMKSYMLIKKRETVC